MLGGEGGIQGRGGDGGAFACLDYLFVYLFICLLALWSWDGEMGRWKWEMA